MGYSIQAVSVSTVSLVSALIEVLQMKGVLSESDVKAIAEASRRESRKGVPNDTAGVDEFFTSVFPKLDLPK